MLLCKNETETEDKLETSASGLCRLGLKPYSLKGLLLLCKKEAGHGLEVFRAEITISARRCRSVLALKIRYPSDEWSGSNPSGPEPQAV